MIKMEQLYYLTQVAKYNSINKAAETLYITASAVSAAMKQLEKECGYAILKRTYRGVKLTKNGEYVLKVAEQVLALCDSLKNINEEEYRDMVVKKNLILTITISRFLSKRLVGPSSKIPEYFNLIEENKSVEEICHLLSQDTIALVMIDEKKNKLLQMENGITSTILYHSRMYPVSSKNTKFIDAKRKSITKEEFEQLPRVVMGDSIDENISNVVLHTENSMFYAEAILSDRGVGLLAKFAPDLFEVDYRMFKMYEPFSEDEKIIAILSKGSEVLDEVQKLKNLIMN